MYAKPFEPPEAGPRGRGGLSVGDATREEMRN